MGVSAFFSRTWIDDLTLETFLTPRPGLVRPPQGQRVLEGRPASFSIRLNNGDGAAIQWLRNGLPIGGATEPTYTLPAASLADDGALFSARVTSGATVVTSPEAALRVVRIELPAVATATFDFDDGLLPAAGAAFGAGTASDGFSEWVPFVSSNGGVDDSGVLQLTESQNGQSGAFVIHDLNAGAPVYGVAARFDVRIGGGTDVPADGMSFNFGPDLPEAPAPEAEEGVGSGLRVCFDIYDNVDGNPFNSAGEAPAITLKWGNTVVAESRLDLADLVTGDGFAEVIVRLTADGLLDVAFNGKVLLYRTPVPGFGSISGGSFGFYARTGGLNANQWVDNLSLYTYLSAPLRISRDPLAQSVLAGRPATFDVQVNTPEGATYRWLRNGSPISGATSGTYTVPNVTAADDGARFQVEVSLAGQVVTSAEAGLSVLDLAPPATPQVRFDFDSGLPAGATTGGPTAFIDATGGVGDSGVLKLTTSENGQSGGFVSAPVASGAQLETFTLAVDVLAGNGTQPPADGFSINLGPGLSATPPGDAENGPGTGLTLAFDTYDNGGGEAPAIEVRFAGAVLASVKVPLEWVNSGDYQTAIVRVSATGALDFAFGDHVLFRNLQLPGYVPPSGVQVGLYARTGGLNASYWFDNLRLAYTIPATVSITGQPQDALVLAGFPARFEVQVSNPSGTTYQWRRGTTDIPGATQPTYTTPSLGAADDGAIYSVVIRSGAGGVTSRNAVVSILAPFNAGNSPAIIANFNDGGLPADGLAFGTASVQATGGVNDSGFLSLTMAENGQGGAFILPTPASPAPITDFIAVWQMRVGGGTDVPADGFSFAFGPEIGDVAFGEDGAGGGLIIGFDTYDNGTSEVAPEITVRYQGQDVATRPFPITVLRTGDLFKPIGVRVGRTGLLDLYYGETAVYRGLALPGYTPFGEGRFAWGARTGGLNDNHWMDELAISLNTQPAEDPVLSLSILNGDIRVTWTGSGILQSTSAFPTGWSDVAGATSGYTVPASGGTLFFRLRR